MTGNKVRPRTILACRSPSEIPETDEGRVDGKDQNNEYTSINDL